MNLFKILNHEILPRDCSESKIESSTDFYLFWTSLLSRFLHPYFSLFSSFLPLQAVHIALLLTCCSQFFFLFWVFFSSDILARYSLIVSAAVLRAISGYSRIDKNTTVQSTPYLSV